MNPVTKYRKFLTKFIEESREALILDNNWDDDGAAAILPSTYESMSTFLSNHLVFLLTEHNTIIINPEISPCRDGSIDLSWRTKDAELLVNIKAKGSVIASYYGNLNGKGNSIKGFVTSHEIAMDLGLWMKNLA